MKTLFMSWIFPLVPKRLLSRITGVLMRLPAPGFVKGPFAKFFKINVSEAEKPLEEYPTLDALFTRKLRAGLRPIEGSIIHPADGRLTEQGVVEAGNLLQAKGWTYPLGEFLGDPALAKVYEGGTFLTYYLCPADYHRVHSAASGNLISAKHIPGLLWPVNKWSVNKIKRLFCLNERVVLNFNDPERGRWSLVFVAATNVGYMTITVDPSICTKQWFWGPPTERTYAPAKLVKAGDELGIFHLGSTVICVFEKTFGVKAPGIEQPVKMGGRLA